MASFKPRSTDTPALVCVPWAGSGAAPFRAWTHAFGQNAGVYGVRLPGRESRIEEAFLRDVDAMVAGIVDDVLDLGPRPIVLFGLCSGALLAHEAARVLGSRVSHLFVASQLPPIDAARVAAEELESREALAERYLTAEAAADPEMAELLLEVLEADIGAVSGYHYTPGGLEIPITVFRGSDDHEISADLLDGWTAESTGRVAVREISGADHLFSGASWPELAAEIAAELGLAAN
ncbi:thioesterase II family protein [Kitasatospora sp. NPDC059648]|uniref:thioesterase II family protein n=1 Tax=Kitasatospora sp. NPDC059648 TaxID=3346894 RepID=UPI0036820D18